MALTFPELVPPLGGLTACANRIDLAEHPQLTGLIPDQKTEDIAIVEEGVSCVRLVRERFKSGLYHFHLDYFSTEIFGARTATCNLDEIRQQFNQLVGKILVVNFESKFRLTTSQLPKVGLVNLLGSVGINLGGTTASLSGATIRLGDTVYREIRWKHAPPAPDGSPQYAVEVIGALGQISVSPDLLSVASIRAVDGLNRFVLFKGAKPVVNQ
ncbi:MAG: hypothetical protein IT427_10205 [Pirellulales bacterium]|nr:hypothetical protein [Pirellulales bacterium]